MSSESSALSSLSSSLPSADSSLVDGSGAVVSASSTSSSSGASTGSSGSAAGDLRAVRLRAVVLRAGGVVVGSGAWNSTAIADDSRVVSGRTSIAADGDVSTAAAEFSAGVFLAAGALLAAGAFFAAGAFLAAALLAGAFATGVSGSGMSGRASGGAAAVFWAGAFFAAGALLAGAFLAAALLAGAFFAGAVLPVVLSAVKSPLVSVLDWSSAMWCSSARPRTAGRCMAPRAWSCVGRPTVQSLVGTARPSAVRRWLPGVTCRGRSPRVAVTDPGPRRGLATTCLHRADLHLRGRRERRRVDSRGW